MDASLDPVAEAAAEPEPEPEPEEVWLPVAELALDEVREAVADEAAAVCASASAVAFRVPHL